MKRFLFVAALASLGACDLSTDPEAKPTDPATETFASNLQVDIATMTKTPSGVYFRDLKPGTGAALAGLPTVNISYLEFIKNGSAVASVQSAVQPLGNLIEGLREGMQGMRPGGERIIVVPSALGYGPFTPVAGVPPNSTLIFDLIFNAYFVP